MDRFAIVHKANGVQLCNEYILKIANAINKYQSDRGITLDNPNHTYGMICNNAKLLTIWESILSANGYI